MIITDDMIKGLYLCGVVYSPLTSKYRLEITYKIDPQGFPSTDNLIYVKYENESEEVCKQLEQELLQKSTIYKYKLYKKKCWKRKRKVDYVLDKKEQIWGNKDNHKWKKV